MLLTKQFLHSCTVFGTAYHQFSLDRLISIPLLEILALRVSGLEVLRVNHGLIFIKMLLKIFKKSLKILVLISQSQCLEFSILTS